MLIRRLSLLFPGLICSSFVMAGEGFYVGAGAGVNITPYSFNSHLQQIDYSTGVVTEADEITDFSTDESVFVGEVSAGYQWLFLGQRMIYSLAVEGFVDFKSTDFKHSNPTESWGEYTTEARMGNLYGASLKPGMFVTNNFLVYLDIGAVFTRLDDIQSSYSDMGAFAENAQPSGSFASKNLWGLRTGAGVQWLWNRQFSVDLSWSLDTYNKTISDSRFLVGIDDGGGERLIDIYEVAEINVTHDNTFLLGFNYYFDS